jgi:hypothetical protein
VTSAAGALSTTLWDRQRRAVQAALQHPLAVVTGDRTGKSTVAADLVVACLLGGEHPAVAAWCRRNQIENTFGGSRSVRVLERTHTDASLRTAVGQQLDAAGVLVSWFNRSGRGPGFARVLDREAWFGHPDDPRAPRAGACLVEDAGVQLVLSLLPGRPWPAGPIVSMGWTGPCWAGPADV